MFNLALRLANCTLRNNTAEMGGGLHAQPALAYLKSCHFIDNHALGNGGALWGQTINYKIFNCSFQGNTAKKGGAIYLNSIAGGFSGISSPVLVDNCVLHDNSAERGGAIYLGGGMFASGKLTLTNSTLAYNTATIAGGGIWAATGAQIPATSHLINSIVWFNSAPANPNFRGRQDAVFCNYQDGITGGRMNISSDPLFVNGPLRDLHLAAGSPSLDSGINVLLPPDILDLDGNGDHLEVVPVDFDGKRRIQDDPSAPPMAPIVDMGAYER